MRKEAKAQTEEIKLNKGNEIFKILRERETDYRRNARSMWVAHELFKPSRDGEISESISR